MEETTKLIVSSKENLTQKYGTKFSSVHKLLQKIVASDKNRGITSHIVYIDDKTSSKKFGFTLVASITRQSSKKAIDQLYQNVRPDYMVIFGAGDIIPFQELINLIEDPEDIDSIVPSDLPYACEASYGTQIEKFVGPTRVIGRLPDIPDSADLGYLQNVITAITSFQPMKPERLMNYFAVTAAVWKKSSQQNLMQIFGNHKALKISPPAKGSYSARELKSLVHFYNCHGDALDTKFYGEQRGKYPDAIHSPKLVGKVAHGTVVAAECCYGAQLFSTTDASDGKLNIANTYLDNKAIAFLGSSTIAYGPADSLDLADYMVQFFIKHIISGSSCGRALLNARQDFLDKKGPELDAHELKTLAQFYLLGDPSLHVVLEEPTVVPFAAIKNERRNLLSKGLNLAETINPCKYVANVKTKDLSRNKDFKDILKMSGFSGKESKHIYEVTPKKGTTSAFAKKKSGNQSVYYQTMTRKVDGAKDTFGSIEVLVVKLVGNQIMGHKIYYSK